MERDGVVARVRDLLVAHLELPATLDDRADLVDEMGLDSITLLEIVTLLEDAFDVEIDDAAVDPVRLRSLGAIADLVVECAGEGG